MARGRRTIHGEGGVSFLLRAWYFFCATGWILLGVSAATNSLDVVERLLFAFAAFLLALWFLVYAFTGRAA